MQDQLTKGIDCMSVNVDDLPFTFASKLGNKAERLYRARREEKQRMEELREFVSLFQQETIPDNLQKYFNLLPEDARRELEFLSERYDTVVLNKEEESISWIDNMEGITEFYKRADEDIIDSLMEEIVISRVPYKDCTRRFKYTPIRSPPNARDQRVSPIRSPPEARGGLRLALPRLRATVEEEF